MKNVHHITRTLLFVVALVTSAAFAEASVERGIEQYNQKQFQAAVDTLRPEVEKQPDNRDARYYLAMSLLELKQYQQAQDHLSQLAGDKESVEKAMAKVHLGLARARIGLEQYAAARESLNAAASLDPDNPDILLRRAEVSLNQKDYAAAAMDAERVLRERPDDAYAHYYAGIAYSNLKRPDKMVNHFQMFLKLAPNAPEAAKVSSLMRSMRR